MITLSGSRRWVAGLVLGFAVLSVVVGCGSNQVSPNTSASRSATTRHGQFVVSYRPNGGQVRVGPPQSWTMHVETPSGVPVEHATIKVTGGMPDMGHALPTAPLVKPLGGGDYRVEGLQFSMPGSWAVEVHVKANGLSDRAVFDLYLQ